MFRFQLVLVMLSRWHWSKLNSAFVYSRVIMDFEWQYNLVQFGVARIYSSMLLPCRLLQLLATHPIQKTSIISRKGVHAMKYSDSVKIEVVKTDHIIESIIHACDRHLSVRRRNIGTFSVDIFRYHT